MNTAAFLSARLVWVRRALAAVALGAATARAAAVPPPTPPPAPPPAAAGNSEPVQLTFPDNTEVKLLVDYVSKRLGVNIVYAPESLANKRVSIVSPAKIPADSLLVLLESVLRMSGLALIEGDRPVWRSIVPTQAILGGTEAMQKDPRVLAETPGTRVLAQVFELRCIPAANAERAVRPFLSKPGGNAFPVANTNLLVVSDYVSVLRQVASLLAVLDQAGPAVAVRFQPVKHLPADDLAAQVNALLAERERVAYAGSTPPPKGLAVAADARTNQLVIMTPRDDAADVLALVEKLDVPEPKPSESNVRFYKLYSTTADAVLETLRSLELEPSQRVDMPPTSVPPSAPPAPAPAPEPEPTLPGTIPSVGRRPATMGTERFAGPNLPPAAIGATELPKPPAYQPSKAAQPKTLGKGRGAVKAGEATMTADPNTNSIIIIAPPAVQRTYAELIKQLDKRRPQVMVEVFLVTLDENDARSLGVEMSNADKDDKRVVFSSLFGLNKVDETTGQLLMKPTSGFHGGLVGPDTFNFLLSALASRTRTKVVSAPRLLVNDNATATLVSQAEAPFTSVNASDTVATTSFAGYVGAGTTITVTPHISEGDHLQLRYSVTLNSFGQSDSSAGIPPPRQTNAVDSEATIPDAYAIVVGGLATDNTSRTTTKVPLLGDVDWLRHLFRSDSSSDARSRFYVFIRPMILRDDLFVDLKHISDRDLERAAQPPNFPTSEAMVLP
ncbi:MAG: hypothetical protein FJ291_15335 [Planctomycetes bacterium]|nr:hypothetical protein [Planctomycetota bacterium]